MLRASFKAVQEIPLWQKVIIGAAGALAAQACLKAVEYYLRETEEPFERELNEFLREFKLKGKLSETECRQLKQHIIQKLNCNC